MSAYVVKLLRAYEVMRVSVAEWHSAADCKLSGKRSTGSWEKRKWNSESSNKETSSEQIGLLNVRIIIWPLLPAFPIYSRTSSPPKKAHFEKLPAEIASNQGVAWCPKDIPQATWGSRRWYFVDMGWILGNEVDISSQMMKLGQVKRWAIKRFQTEMACFGHFILGAEAFCCRRPWNWMSWMRWRWSWKSGRSHGVFGTRTLELKKCLQDYLIFYQIGHTMKAHYQKLQKHFSLTIVPFISSWSLLWQHSESTNSMHKNCLLVRIPVMPVNFFLFLRWFELKRVQRSAQYKARVRALLRSTCRMFAKGQHIWIWYLTNHKPLDQLDQSGTVTTLFIQLWPRMRVSVWDRKVGTRF